MVLARGLFRCGDHEGLGRAILERFAHDLRGLYSQHALAVLNRGPGRGDVDGNGRVNAVDALLVWRIDAGDDPAPPPGSRAAREADVDEDGDIDGDDANLILIKSVGEVGR